jgi:hypothetical protein
MLTPTFFAGACIVFAATLAYGTTQTHLVFRGVGPACAVASCTAASPGAGSGSGVQYGTSATPDIGRRVQGNASPGATRHGRASGADPAGGPGAGQAPSPGADPGTGDQPGKTASGGNPPVPRVVITYQTVRSWRGGFVAAMTITNRGGSAIAAWRLWMHYRHARVDHVSGARWSPAGAHAPGAGVVAPRPGQLVLAARASTWLSIRARGRAGPPDGCLFNSARCSFLAGR